MVLEGPQRRIAVDRLDGPQAPHDDDRDAAALERLEHFGQCQRLGQGGRRKSLRPPLERRSQPRVDRVLRQTAHRALRQPIEAVIRDAVEKDGDGGGVECLERDAEFPVVRDRGGQKTRDPDRSGNRSLDDARQV